MSQSLPAKILGRSGLSVTWLGYGGMEIRGAPRGRPVTDDQMKTILNVLLDAGINFLDTANDYGRSEEFIGKYISHRRSEYYLATKCGCHPDGEHIWTKENLLRGLHESLQRLRTDYVDLIQLHNPTVQEREQGNLVAALQEMREQGKVRWIGASTTLPHLPTFLNWNVFDVFQIPYAALMRDHEGWITKAAQAGVGTVIRSGVSRDQPGVGSYRVEQYQKYDEAKLDELREAGESRTAFMLRFTLTHPDVQTVIVGTVNPEHLLENIRTVARGRLSPDIYEEAKRRLDRIGLEPEKVS